MKMESAGAEKEKELSEESEGTAAVPNDMP